MRVLVIHNTYKWPGGEDVVVDRETALLRAFGHEVVEYRRSNQELDTDSRSRFGAFTGSLWSKTAYLDLMKVIEESRPDVAHVHNTLAVVSPSVYYACDRLGIPVVQTLHNYRLICPRGDLFREGSVCEQCVAYNVPWPALKNRCYHSSVAMTAAVATIYQTHRLLRTWSKKVAIYVTPSEFAGQKLRGGMAPAERIVVKPHFVFPDPGQRERPGSYAIFIGRLSAEKNLQSLLTVWHEFKQLPLKVLGTGNLEHELQAYARQSGLSNVEFCGHRSQRDVFTALKGAAFLIFPSQWYETFGLGIVEAYSCGVPVIASQLGAMSEIVKDGESGLLFRPEDPADLTAKIRWAMDHPAKMEEMGRYARKLFETCYTGERNHELMMKIYHCAIETTRSSRRRSRLLSPR
jgi:glycosyltransferase involved in cell wall biosynthesis